MLRDAVKGDFYSRGYTPKTLENIDHKEFVIVLSEILADRFDYFEPKGLKLVNCIDKRIKKETAESFSDFKTGRITKKEAGERARMINLSREKNASYRRYFDRTNVGLTDERITMDKRKSSEIYAQEKEIICRGFVRIFVHAYESLIDEIPSLNTTSVCDYTDFEREHTWVQINSLQQINGQKVINVMFIDPTQFEAGLALDALDNSHFDKDLSELKEKFSEAGIENVDYTFPRKPFQGN